MEKETQNIKKNQSEIENIVTEVKNTLEGINSSFDEAEDQISDLEDEVAENIQSGKQKEKKNLKINEDRGWGGGMGRKGIQL